LIFFIFYFLGIGAGDDAAKNYHMNVDAMTVNMLNSIQFYLLAEDMMKRCHPFLFQGKICLCKFSPTKLRSPGTRPQRDRLSDRARLCLGLKKSKFFK